MPVLAVVGVDDEGKRDVLGFCIGEGENQKAWENFLENLKARGVDQVALGITDGNKGMLNAIENKLPTSRRQRCIKHKMENVLAYVPKKHHEEVRLELKAIFYQDHRAKADQEVAAFIARYESVYPGAIECLRRDLEDCLTFYDFPQEHWQYIHHRAFVRRGQTAQS